MWYEWCVGRAGLGLGLMKKSVKKGNLMTRVCVLSVLCGVCGMSGVWGVLGWGWALGTL